MKILLVGGFDGLRLYTAGKDSTIFSEVGRIEGLPFARIQIIVPGLDKNSYWVGTEDEGLYLVKGEGASIEGYTAMKVGEDQGLAYSSVNALFASSNGYLWVSDYGYGIYRFKANGAGELTEKLYFDENSGIPEQYIKDIFQDDEGNMWFASQSHGIAVLRDQAFTFYDMEQGEDVPSITAISVISENNWFAADGQVQWIDAKNPMNRKLYGASVGLPGDKITDLYEDPGGNLYVATEYTGVYLMKAGTGRFASFFKADNSLGNSINALTGNDENIWLATNNGTYQISLTNGHIENRSMNNGLPHNVVNDIMIDHEGEVWIATRSSGIHSLASDQELVIEGNPFEFVQLAEDQAGRIWAATKEDGVIMFDRDSIVVYNEENGLKAKYTYAVGIDQNEHVWVGHRLGLSRIDPETQNMCSLWSGDRIHI